MRTLFASMVILIISNSIVFSQLLTPSQQYEQRIKERQERERRWLEQMNNVSDSFPRDIVVLDYWPSCLKGIHYYYPDGTYAFQYKDGTPTIEIGKWTREGDKIVINLTTEVGMRNFGTPLNIDELGGRDDCPEEIYAVSFKYEKYVKQQSEFILGNYFHSDRFIDTTMRATDFNLAEHFVDGKYKVASCRKINNSDLEQLDKSELRLMRNEIFARYGYIFNDIKLQAYFSKQDWYKPRGRDVDKYLTQLEKDNIKLIQEFEKK